MSTIDIYKHRGFTKYYKELPDAPDEPVYDIKLWLSFAEGSDGLINCDPYGVDYCDGEWLQFLQYYNGTDVSHAIPKDFVSTDDNPNTGTKYLTWPDHGGYDKAYPQIKTNVTYPENGFTIGSWVYTDKTKDNTRLPMIYLYDSLGGSIYMNYYATYWTAGLSGGTYVYASQALTTGWYFVQWYFDYTNNTIALKVNGNNVSLDSSELPSAWQLLDCVQIYIDMQSPYKDATGINNIIYSEDLTLDMYAEEYNGVKICNLTQYPTAIAPTITTQPQSESVFEGQSFSELTVVAVSNGGGTLTYQWQSYSGSAWSDVVGETTDAYTPSVAGTYRCQVSNDNGTTNSNSAVLVETTEIDFFEYATNGAAQAAYVTSDSEVLQSYSESTIKTQGSYSLKASATTGAVSTDAYTKSLLNFNDTDESTTFTDDTGKTWTAHSNAQIDTSDKKFGTGSGLFASATSDYIDTPDSDDFNIASSDGTIEFWIKRSSKDTVQWICGQLTSSTTNAMHTLRFLDTNEVRYWSDCTDGYVAFNSSTTITDTDTWHHIAVVKYGNTVTMYIDGTSVGSEDITGKTFINGGTAFAIGRAGELSTFTLNARVDGFRFSDTAKYTSNFTPSTSEFVFTTYATLTYTFDPTLDFTNIDYVNLNIRSSRTGSNIKLGLHDTGGVTSEITPNITDADEWQNVEWDLSGVSDANKNAVDKLIITIVNADSANTFYIDAFEVGEGDGVAEGTILFGTHFDSEDDWDSSNAEPPTEWDSATMTNIGETYNVGDISATGKHGASGKGFTQRWAYRESSGTAQDCWLNKGNIAFPDEFWIGYWFKIDANFSMPAGNPVSLKIMKLQFDNSTTWDIYWTNFCAGCEDYNVPTGCGYSICTDEYGKNWFGSYNAVDDGDWHSFIWHIKHSTNTLELFVDGVDAAQTAYTPDFPGTGMNDTYGIHFGGNISGNGIATDGAYTMYDDVCIGTTRAKVEEYLGI